MNLESLFEVLLPLAILAFFLLQGLFKRPDPIDSFEPPPPSPQPQPAPASAGPPGHDEVKARPKRLDTSSYRRSRDKEALAKDARPKVLGSKPLGQLKAQAAKLNREEAQLNRGETRKKRPSLDMEEAHSTRKAFEKLSPEQIRKTAREIFYLKELLDKPLSLRSPDQSV